MRNVKRWLIVLAGLMFLLGPAGSWAQAGSAPEIVGNIEFLKQIDAGSRAEGKVCFKDPDGDVILAQFAVLAGVIQPFSFNPQVEGKTEGCFSFTITAPTTAQRVTMIVILIDKAGHQSVGKSFSFDVISSVPSAMVLIPAGSFQMGDSFGEGDSDEKPVHSVNVSAFTMDKFEVTKALWDEVATWAAAHGYDIKPGDGDGKAANHPVQSVSWYEAVKWANARSEKEGLTPAYYTNSAEKSAATVYRTGQVNVTSDWVRWDTGYRLPTEAEWEKAARGGASGHRFPWSDVDTIQHAWANYYSDSRYSYDTSPTREFHPTYNTGNNTFPYTSPVGSFAPNGYGLYDMAGNVWEWAWDWYDSGYYSRSAGSDPRGSASGSDRVHRGGGWSGGAFNCRVAYRTGSAPGYRYGGFGFRVVRPPGQ